MATPAVIWINPRRRLIWIWLGVLLTIAGFLCHYFAARAIGGSYIAFRDHIAGFFIILLVTGAIIAGLGWKFWKDRHDFTVLLIGLVQAIFGYWVYLNRFSVHG